MDYDQKAYLELLQPYKSEETKKSRRNVVQPKEMAA